MAKFSGTRTKEVGFCGMSGKVNLGVPRKLVSGKSGSISKADSRGKGDRIVKG